MNQNTYESRLSEDVDVCIYYSKNLFSAIYINFDPYFFRII